MRPYLLHPTFPDCGSVFPFPLSFPFALKGWAFPFPCIPFLCCLGWRGFSWRGPWLAGIRDCGDWLPLAGLAGRDSVSLAAGLALAHPAKIRVSTYCETGLSSDIFTAEMRTDRYETFLLVSVPCGLRFAFPCDSRGKVNEASLAAEAWANWQWILNHGHERPVIATLHIFPAYKAD